MSADYRTAHFKGYQHDGYIHVTRVFHNGRVTDEYGIDDFTAEEAAEIASMFGPRLTAEEFEAVYAARSNLAVPFLHAWGRYAERCDCAEDGCEGWRMGHQWEDALAEDHARSTR